MAYLFYLPSLLCGLAIGIEDVRRRHVPAPWVLVGSLAQLISNIIAAAVGNTFFTVLQSMLFALLSLGVMALLALARSGGLGANEIKAMAPAGLAVGMCGLPAVIIWWLCILLFGTMLTVYWRRTNLRRQRHPALPGPPYVPAIVVAAVLAVAVTTI